VPWLFCSRGLPKRLLADKAAASSPAGAEDFFDEVTPVPEDDREECTSFAQTEMLKGEWIEYEDLERPPHKCPPWVREFNCLRPEDPNPDPWWKVCCVPVLWTT
jgi:hypothetical protein